MEHFFSTGKGHPYDASPHLYAMMLSNLAVVYREIGRNEEAIEISRRGIPVSPFGALYHNILLAYLNLKDHANVVKAAEDLWQFAVAHGGHHYCEDGPTNYVRLVAESLYELERAREIPIWLERLTRWEREEAGMDEDNLSDDVLYSRLIVAFYTAAVEDNREISRAVWRRIALQVKKSDNRDLWQWAADLLRVLESWEEAISFYERSLAVRKNEKIEEFLARCQKKLAEKNAPPVDAKRWWQVWK
jgi:tetratricopeptide (TPR) repeat protein